MHLSNFKQKALNRPQLRGLKIEYNQFDNKKTPSDNYEGVHL